MATVARLRSLIADLESQKKTLQALAEAKEKELVDLFEADHCRVMQQVRNSSSAVFISSTANQKPLTRPGVRFISPPANDEDTAARPSTITTTEQGNHFSAGADNTESCHPEGGTHNSCLRDSYDEEGGFTVYMEEPPLPPTPLKRTRDSPSRSRSPALQEVADTLSHWHPSRSPGNSRLGRTGLVTQPAAPILSHPTSEEPVRRLLDSIPLNTCSPISKIGIVAQKTQSDDEEKSRGSRSDNTDSQPSRLASLPRVEEDIKGIHEGIEAIRQSLVLNSVEGFAVPVSPLQQAACLEVKRRCKQAEEQALYILSRRQGRRRSSPSTVRLTDEMEQIGHQPSSTAEVSELQIRSSPRRCCPAEDYSMKINRASGAHETRSVSSRNRNKVSVPHGRRKRLNSTATVNATRGTLSVLQRKKDQLRRACSMKHAELMKKRCVVEVRRGSVVLAAGPTQYFD